MKIVPDLSFKASFAVSAFSAGDISLRGYLVSASESVALDDSHFEFLNADLWEISLSATETGALAPGKWQLQLVAVMNDSSGEFDAGSVDVLVASKLGDATDARSKNEIILEQLDAVIAQKSTQGYDELTIDGRSIKRMSWEDILQAHKYFSSRVAAEKSAAAGGSRVKRIKMAFTRS
jgi:hypothetical protein